MPKVDPVCVFHGKKWSEHVCLVCCLCFKDLEPEECTMLPTGVREDVCFECTHEEALLTDRYWEEGWELEMVRRG